MSALLAGWLLTGCASQSRAPVLSSQDAQDQVRAATASWVAAYNSRDPARIMAFYAPDAVFWGTTSAALRATPEAIADYFKDAGKRPHARVELVEQHVRVFGQLALNSGRYVFHDLRNGQAVSRPARFSMAFAFRDGRWILVDHHSSEVK